jgi:hypothetical protein
VIFHSYVNLPEGTMLMLPIAPWDFAATVSP